MKLASMKSGEQGNRCTTSAVTVAMWMRDRLEAWTTDELSKSRLSYADSHFTQGHKT